MVVKKASFIAVLAVLVMAFASPMDASAQQQNVGQVNAGNLIAALNNINANIQDVQALNDLTVADVQVVNVEDVLNDLTAFNNALNRNDVDINVLRDFLNDLTITDIDVLRNALQNANVNINDVVAISVLSGGDVVLYYQP